MQVELDSGTSLGYDDVGQGQPLVLLHAFPLTRAMWQPQLDGLSQKCRVIAIDSRGFGTSTGPLKNLTIDQMADDVADFLQSEEIREPIVLAGLSMGGYIALRFALRYRDRLAGLVLADTRAEADNAEGRANRDKMIAFAQEHSPADVLEQMLPRLLGAETQSQRPEIVARVRAMAAGATREGIIAALQAMRDRAHMTASLPVLRVPTLVLVGREDLLTPPALAESMARGLPRARLITIPGAGHLATLEQPDLCNRAISEFIEALS